jgi:hypothetical protein
MVSIPRMGVRAPRMRTRFRTFNAIHSTKDYCIGHMFGSKKEQGPLAGCHRHGDAPIVRDRDRDLLTMHR